MEANSTSFSFLEQDQPPMNTTSISTEIMSSWLDFDDFYTPSFTHDYELPYLEIPNNEHLLQFLESDFNADPVFDSSSFDFWEDCRETSTSRHHHQSTVTQSVVGPPLTDEEDITNGFIIDDDDGDPSMFVNMDSSTSEIDKDRLLMKEKVVEISLTSREEEEEEFNINDEEPKEEQFSCKNLVSERNRRKRISQQLLALRALVPNITKMDKRSILMDALNYLRSIHEEIQRTEKDLSNNLQIKEASRVMQPIPTISSINPRKKSHILEIDTERLEEKRYVVKISGKGGPSIGGDVVRVIESLGFEIAFNSVEIINPHHLRATAFIKVKNTEKMTEEKLKEQVRKMALQSGMQMKD